MEDTQLFIFNLLEMTALGFSLALFPKLLPAFKLSNESLENPKFRNKLKFLHILQALLVTGR